MSRWNFRIPICDRMNETTLYFIEHMKHTENTQFCISVVDRRYLWIFLDYHYYRRAHPYPWECVPHSSYHLFSGTPTLNASYGMIISIISTYDTTCLNSPLSSDWCVDLMREYAETMMNDDTYAISITLMLAVLPLNVKLVECIWGGVNVSASQSTLCDAAFVA